LARDLPVQPDITFIEHKNGVVAKDMCDACSELDRQIGHLWVIEQVADTGTRYAATKLIEEKEAQKGKAARRV
jgi:hypothetical protein